jgi:biopolymer transport protein ExbD
MDDKNSKKKKAPAAIADINVTPMVDVMLVMLIIFMVITPMLSKGITVDLVKTRNPIAMANADKDDTILVAVARDGRTYLGSNPTPADQLPPKVKDLLTNKLDKTVYVKSDSRARYEKVVDVIDNLRAAGVDNVGMITESMDKKDTAKPETKK